jgi:hypothetical protein
MNWDIEKQYATNYLTSCLIAALDDQTFNNFKKDPYYQGILEHISYQESLWYLDNLLDENLMLNNLAKLRENDNFCNAEILDYENIGKFSPSTIRYIKQSVDIAVFFKDKNIRKVFEIGGGYGGLCKTLNVFIDFDAYVIADFDNCNKLSSRYLNLFKEFDNKIFYQDCENLKEENDIDLLISNYAVSELDWDGQLEYYEKIIKNSTNFYITYNFINNSSSPYEKFIELCSKDFDVEIKDDNLFSNRVLFGVKRG